MVEGTLARIGTVTEACPVVPPPRPIRRLPASKSIKMGSPIAPTNRPLCPSSQVCPPPSNDDDDDDCSTVSTFFASKPLLPPSPDPRPVVVPVATAFSSTVHCLVEFLLFCKPPTNKGELFLLHVSRVPLPPVLLSCLHP